MSCVQNLKHSIMMHCVGMRKFSFGFPPSASFMLFSKCEDNRIREGFTSNKRKNNKSVVKSDILLLLFHCKIFLFIFWQEAQ